MTANRPRGVGMARALAAGLLALVFVPEAGALQRGPGGLSTRGDPDRLLALTELRPAPPVVALEPADRIAIALRSGSLSPAAALSTARALADAAAADGHDPFLLLAVIEVESAYDHRAVSSAGAQGLMQLMPRTAGAVAEASGVVYPDAFDPATNVRLGSRYLAEMRARFGGDWHAALTAYNRGPGNTRAILARFGGLPDHVRAFYSDKVLRRYARLVEAP